MTRYVHTYIDKQHDDTRVITSPYRHFKGRSGLLLRSFILKSDGSLMEVPALHVDQAKRVSS